jgi:hypothetical protein
LEFRIFYEGENLRRAEPVDTSIEDLINKYLTKTDKHITLVVSIENKVIFSRCNRPCAEHKFKLELPFKQ